MTLRDLSADIFGPQWSIDMMYAAWYAWAAITLQMPDVAAMKLFESNLRDRLKTGRNIKNLQN